jgi:Ala-tRNA(Pro) deacylase
VLHISGRQVVKSVLLHGPRGYMVAVLPCDRHLDLDKIASHAGGSVRLASPAEMAEVFQDCEWGVVPSFGAMYGLPVLLEETLGADELLVFEGQSSFLAIRMRCGDFERLERACRLSLIAAC